VTASAKGLFRATGNMIPSPTPSQAEQGKRPPRGNLRESAIDWDSQSEWERRAAIRAQGVRFRSAMLSAHPELGPRPVRIVPPQRVLLPPRRRDWLLVGSSGLTPAPEARHTVANDPAWALIAREVAAKHHVSRMDMESPRRDKEVVAARQEVFYRLKNETLMSLPAIGRKFKRDHTTVIYGIRKHGERMKAGQG
jgi:hypothetical protein